MAEIQGLREQILANYAFMESSLVSSKVDVVVRFLDNKYYRASIADKSSGQDVYVEPHRARTVKDALSHLLTQTCASLGGSATMDATNPVQAIESPAAKRRPGRPKSILPTATTSAKPAVNPRARRTAVAAVTPKVVTTRSRGRPRKSDVALAAPTSLAAAQDAAVAVMNRGRGRPRKLAEATDFAVPQEAAPAKRGRGRPRKSDATLTAATKRSASAVEQEDVKPKKSRKNPATTTTTTDDDDDEEIQTQNSADELADDAAGRQTAPFQTPTVWFPTYLSRISRVVYHCITDAGGGGGASGGPNEAEIAARTGLRPHEVRAGLKQLRLSGGIQSATGVATDTEADSHVKWVVLDEWDDEED